MAHFSVLPPEINSLRMYLGAGSAPMLQAAASVGPEPAPANINAELTSGGNTRKLITPSLPQLDVPGPSPPVTTNLRWLNTHSPILPARSSAAVPPA